MVCEKRKIFHKAFSLEILLLPTWYSTSLNTADDRITILSWTKNKNSELYMGVVLKDIFANCLQTWIQPLIPCMLLFLLLLLFLDGDLFTFFFSFLTSLSFFGISFPLNDCLTFSMLPNSNLYTTSIQLSLFSFFLFFYIEVILFVQFLLPLVCIFSRSFERIPRQLWLWILLYKSIYKVLKAKKCCFFGNFIQIKIRLFLSP